MTTGLARWTVALALAGCGASTVAPVDGGGDVSRADRVSFAPDSQPCTHDPLPQVPDQGGERLAAPRLVAVTFANEPNRDALEAFATWAPTSDWLARVGAEYGVGRGALAATVRVASPAPAAVTDAQIQAWIAASLADGTLPDAGANALYMLFYPSSTTITVPSAGTTLESCSEFGGYHSALAMRTPTVAYAVVASCPTPPEPGVNALEYEQLAASHELIEAATDASPALRPAYSLAGSPSPWAALGFEIGDLCEGAGARVDGFVVQQVWSNAAAMAGVNPCVPSSGEPYFSVHVPAPLVRTVHPGDEVDLPVTGWSTGPVAPWNVQAIAQSTFDPPITAQLESTTLGDCETTTLHVQIPASAPSGGLAGVGFYSNHDPLESHGWGVSFFVEADGGSPGSCTIGSICTDYGPPFTPMLVMQSCPASSARYSPTPCPTAGRVGRCVHHFTTSGYEFTFTESFYAPDDASTVMSLCVSSGPNDMATFEPG